MPTIDERIVEMRFENDQFQKGVKESQASLENLKASLRMEDSVKSVADSLDKISYRFSVAGIAVEQLTKNITNSFYAMTGQLKNQIMDLTFNQVGQGFDKYERKLQSVQTIINATGKSIDDVNVSLDKLNWFTDETSYDFTSMVDNIGKFTSNQIPLETAVTSMIGIADAAGLAGASVTDASHAMDGFSKAMGQGYMSRQNWQWIRTAHMDTAKFKETLIEAAAEMGKLKKVSDGVYETLDGAEVTIANFEEGLKDKWMNVDVMNAALAKFGGTTEKIYDQYLKTGKLTSDIIKEMGDNSEDLGLKAFKAAQEAKTFTDAINSVKDAVSTGWMTSFEYMFGNYDEAKVMWTNLANEMWDVFNGGAEDRNELLKAWHFDYKGYESALRSIGNLWEGIKNMVLPVTESFRKFFPKTTVETLAHLTAKFEEFSVKFRDFFSEAGAYFWPFTEAAEDVGEAVETVTKKVKKVVEVVEQVEGPVSRTTKILDQLARQVMRGDYGNGQERINKLRELGYSYELVQNRVNELCEAEEKRTKGYYGRYKVIEDEVKTITKEVEVEEEATEAVEEQVEAIKKYVNETPRKTYVVQNLVNAFEGFFSVLRLVTDTFKAVAKGMTPVLKIGVQLFEIFTSIAGAIGIVVKEITNSIRESGILEKITEKLNKVFTKLSKLLEPVVDWFSTLHIRTRALIRQVKNLTAQILELESVKRTIRYFQEFADLVKNTVTTNFKKFIDYVKELVKIDFKMPTTEDILKMVDEAAKKFNKFLEFLKEQNPGEAVQGWWSTIANGAGGIWQTLLSTIQDPNSIFGKAFEAARQFGSGLVEGLDSLNLDNILSILSTGSLAYFLYSFATALRGATKMFKQVDLLQIDSLITSIRTVLASVSKNLKAEAFIKMAKAVGILALAMIGLAQLDKEQIASVTVSIVGVILALKLLMDAMTALNYSKAANSMSGIKGIFEGIAYAFSNAFMWQSFGVMLVGIAASLVIFVKALRDMVKLVNESTGDDIKDALAIFALFLGSFGVFVGLITYLTKNMNAAQKAGFGKIFFNIGAGMLMMAFAVKTLIGPFTELVQSFKTATAVEIGAGIVAIVAMAGALAGLAYVLSKSGGSGAQLFAIGAGLIFFSYAIKLLAPLLQDFWHWFVDFLDGNKNLEKVGGVVLGIAAAFGVLVAIAALAPGHLFSLSYFLQSLGKVLIGVGVAAIGIGLGIRIAGDSLEAFARGLVGMLKIIRDNAPLVISAVTVIIGGILTALVSQKGRLLVTLISVFMAVTEAISAVGPQVIETIFEQIQAGIGYFVSILGEIVKVFVYMVIQVINALADAIDENRGPILDAIERLIKAFHALLKDGIQRIFPWMDDGFAGLIATFGTVATAAAPLIAAVGGISAAFGKLKSGFGKVKAGFLAVFGYFGKLFNAFKIFRGVLATGGTGMQGFAQIMANGLGMPVFLTMAGVATAAILGIGGAVNKLRKEEEEQIRAQNKLGDAQQDYVDTMSRTYDAYKQKSEKTYKEVQSILDEYEGYSTLAAEYDKLLDENGKVIEGNEQNADLILGKLSSALGVEKQYLQDLVTEHGNLQSAIDETIRKEEAHALISSMQDEYLDAMSNRSRAQADVDTGNLYATSAKIDLDKAKRDRDALVDKLSGITITDRASEEEYYKITKELDSQNILVSQLQTNYDQLAEARDRSLEELNGYEEIIQNYEGMRYAYEHGEYNTIKDLIDKFQNAVPEALRTAKNATRKELADQLNDLSTKYDQLRVAAAEGNADVTAEMISGASNTVNAARDEFLKSFGLFDESGNFCGSAYTDAVKEQLSLLSPDIIDYIENVLKPSMTSDTSEQGTATAETYKAGILAALANGGDVSSQVEAIKSLFDIETAPEGQEGGDEYLAGLIGSLGEGEISLDQAIDGIVNHFDIGDKVKIKGEEADDAVAEGINNNTEVIDTAAEDAVNSGVNSGKDAADKNAPGVGNNFDNGVAQGAYDNAEVVRKAGAHVGGLLASAARAALKVASPSKVAMGISRFFDLGLARGALKYSYLVADGSTKVSNIMVDSMHNAISTAYDLLDGSGDLNPTITPVLDLSEIQNGTNSLNGMFGNRSFSLASANGIRFEANRLEAMNKLETATTNADVVAALGLLRGDVNNLNDSMGGLQVVMDSGQLVGAISRPMDNALGRQNMYKKRGI